MTTPTETPPDECRKEFEEWHLESYGVPYDRHCSHSAGRWHAWKACWNRTSPPASNEGLVDRERPRGRMFYPKESKVYDKWVKTAGDNPMIMADVSFETFLAGWNAAMRHHPAPAPAALAGLSVDDIEKAIFNAPPERIIVRQELRQRTGEPIEVLNERVENRATPRHQALAVFELIRRHFGIKP